MRAKVLLCLLSGLAASLAANAQFFTAGSEPASVKWREIHTPTYRIVYPYGLDSLARVYAVTLEQVAGPVGNSAGFRPNESYRNRMPVILHAHTAYSNGQVTWTPRRMDLLTVPDAFSPEPTPWERQLTIHESRHVAQMQYTAARPFRFWNVISGQLISGALAAVYCGPAFFEGDAVAAETALTSAGRGRTADFLEYMRVSFASGDMRDYWKWRYGSQRYYTPDYYRVGYIASAGIRELYGIQDFTAYYYGRLARHHGVAFNNYGKSVKEVSGRNFKTAFREICDSLTTFWAGEEDSRAPFIEPVQLTPDPSRFTEFTGLSCHDGGLYAIRSGITSPEELVRIDSTGNATRESLFSASASGLRYSAPAGRMYWSETVRDPRWEWRSYSDIRYTDSKGRRGTLTHGKRYYNPAASSEKCVISVTEYPVEGGSAVRILDALTGEEAGSFPAPDGLQVVETAWSGERVFASAISGEGYGIYEATGGYSCILQPQHVKIKQLWSDGGTLMFTCDRTGVNELYSLDPDTSRLLQLTSTRHGGSDFQLSPGRDTLYFASLKPDGRMIYSIPVDSLDIREADFSVHAGFPFADGMSRGEPVKIDYSENVEVSEPVKYSRLAHLFRIHSWLPLYVDYDEISSLSMSSLTSSVSPGATVFFQNDLGDAYGTAGYKASRSSGEWRHSGHFKFTYTGFYPVIEASMDFNDRNAYRYIMNESESGSLSLRAYTDSRPLLLTTLSTYVPLYFSRGGNLAGVIPKISISATNDRYDNGTEYSYMTRATASIRAYIMERIPESRIYPRLGIGVEAGYSGRPEVASILSGNAYIYAYGYLPGLWCTHGLKLTAMHERLTGDGIFCEAYLNTAPRGFSSYVASLMSAYTGRTRISADYAMPLFPVDWSWLSPVAYIRNFELIPHADLARYSAKGSSGTLFSTGADLNVRLGNFLWIPYDTRIGITFDYNGGSLFEKVQQLDHANPWTFGATFSIDF